MPIIIDRVSCINEDAPTPDATLNEYYLKGSSFPYKVWLLAITIEEAVKSFGRCVVSYNQELEMFRVVIYDDYIE